MRIEEARKHRFSVNKKRRARFPSTEYPNCKMKKLRATLRAGASAAVYLMATTYLTGVASCSSNGGSSPAGLSQGCTLNSDCSSPFVCVFARCHQQCNVSGDCLVAGARCVTVMGPHGSEGGVCQLSVETGCGGSIACPGDQVCGSDMQCRASCATTPCLGMQSCVSNAGMSACYEPDNPFDHSTVGDAGSDSGTPVGGGDAGGDSASLPDGGDGGSLTMDSGSSDGTVGPDGHAEASSDATPDVSLDASNVPPPEAGSIGFMPTNFVPSAVSADGGSDGGIWANAPDVTLSSGCSNCLGVTAVTIEQNDVNATLADLYVMKSLTVSATASITLSGPRPIILAVLNSADIQGVINVTAGGFGQGSGATGPGAGANGTAGSGGGSYCGVGGNSAGAPLAAGGPTYGNATLSPLVGGSAGGYNSGTPCGGQRGPGGGAIQIVAGSTINVRQYAAINVGGGGGGTCNGLGGGGSGGAILLEAPMVVIRGNLAANGGGGASPQGVGAVATADANPALGGGTGTDGGQSIGGPGSAGTTINGGDAVAGTSSASGGGGAGRIRINTASGSATISGLLSPDVSTACITQGTIP